MEFKKKIKFQNLDRRMRRMIGELANGVAT